MVLRHVVLIATFVLLVLCYGYVSKSLVERYVADIPKVVHQVYTQGHAALPECVKDVIRFNKETNPDFEFKLYDYDDINEYLHRHTNERVYQAFKYINKECHACVADFFRYVIIYKEGGVYADIKVKFKKPLREWIYNDSKIKLSLWPWMSHAHLGKYYPRNFVFKTKNREINQSVLIYPPKHDYLNHVILNMVTNIYEHHNNPDGKQNVLQTTGPHLYTKVIAPYLNDANTYLSQDDNQLFDGNVIYDGTDGCYHKYQNENKLRWYQLEKKFV